MASKIYIKKSHSLEDAKSTASTFTVMGIIGIVAVALIGVGVIKLPMDSFSKIMFCSVMGLLFLFFIATGIHSFLQIGKLKDASASEENLTKELKEWFLATYTADIIDKYAAVDPQLLSAEQLYFPRTEKMHQLIAMKYQNLDEAFFDEMIEELYSEIF